MFYFYLFVWLPQDLVEASSIFSCCMQDLVPRLGLESGLLH